MYDCDICGREFDTASGLAMHQMRTHADQPWFKKNRQTKGKPAVIVNAKTFDGFRKLDGFILLEDSDGGIWLAERIR